MKERPRLFCEVSSCVIGINKSVLEEYYSVCNESQ